jgi:hypothetical protein
MWRIFWRKDTDENHNQRTNQGTLPAESGTAMALHREITIHRLIFVESCPTRLENFMSVVACIKRNHTSSLSWLKSFPALYSACLGHDDYSFYNSYFIRKRKSQKASLDLVIA